MRPDIFGITVHPSVTACHCLFGSKNGTGLCTKCGNEQPDATLWDVTLNVHGVAAAQCSEAGEAFMVFLLNDPRDELPTTPTGP